MHSFNAGPTFIYSIFMVALVPKTYFLKNMLLSCYYTIIFLPCLVLDTVLLLGGPNTHADFRPPRGAGCGTAHYRSAGA